MSNTEQSPAGEIGVAEAAERFAALMEADQAQPEPAKEEAAPAEAEEAEATEYEAEETAEDGESPVDAAPDDETAEYSEDTEGEAEEAPDLDQTVTVKINGKTEQVTLKEAIEGYQRQSDYSRRMNALREHQQAFVQEQNAVKNERQQYAVLINALQEQLQQLAPQEPDWAKLHEEDPLNFPLVEKQWRDYKERLAATQAEKERLAQMSFQEQQRALKQTVDQGRKVLLEKMPEWRDAKKWTEARGKLVNYGQTIGYSPEELQQAYDPRAILVLEKARRYDDLMANRPKPTKAKGPKPLKSGATSTAPKSVTNITRAKQRLAQTGSVDDAALLFGLLDNRRS